MRIHKVISTILHPIVLPTIGVMLYFLLIPNSFRSNQKFTLLSIVFICTYLIPLLVLFVFKKFKIIKNYQTESIKERKLPVAIMIIVFYVLGNTIYNIANLRDLSMLFHASSLGLFLIYLLFNLKIKASIHLLSFGISIGFFLILSYTYNQSMLLIIIVLLFLSGILASARLHLKAHNNKEIYLGFFIGIASSLSIHFIL
ncbi:hypothetical protein [Polaribacter ponticola]|uniref:Uncharacterized protein n=1 Tax=Polaribacter ponticola TaxID=2978475 RepID=A0ABT5SAF2_9FLAO|nr:hypothetical protein [Polaribacter sp. MSW5]MDD7915068.1 hypothetical protein [Polaribacter sp. MSW5]